MSFFREQILLLLILAVNCHFGPKPETEPPPVDAFKMFESLPNILPVYTSSPDSAYRCMDATLTYFNDVDKESTYVWHFKSPVDHKTIVKEAVFDITEGPTSDQVYYMLDGNACQLYTAKYIYTDYESCIVSTFPYYSDDLCMLWVTKEVVDAIPEHCLSAYHETCPIGYLAYDSEMCAA